MFTRIIYICLIRYKLFSFVLYVYAYPSRPPCIWEHVHLCQLVQSSTLILTFLSLKALVSDKISKRRQSYDGDRGTPPLGVYCHALLECIKLSL